MNKPINDFDDMPEMTDEMMNEFQQLKNVDLHLGAAEVKTFGQRSWVDQHGPKPPGPGILALDVLIVFLSCAMCWLTVNVWIWTFS
jgi:hypothetical protein